MPPSDHRSDHRSDHQSDHRSDRRSDHQSDHQSDHRSDHRSDRQSDRQSDRRSDRPTAAARIGVRELRNQVSAVLRRAAAGERLIITVDGLPTAQIGPIGPSAAGPDLDQLIASGMVHPPRRADRGVAPTPMALPVDISVDGVLDDLRGR